MQVNLSANLLNPAGETNAKSTDVSEAGATGGFLAEMGHLLNQSDESSETKEGGTLSMSVSNSGRNNPQRSSAGARLTSRQAPGMKKNLAQDLIRCIPPSFQTQDGADSATPDAVAAQKAAEMANGLALPNLVETSPLQTGDDEKGMEGFIPLPQTSGGPAAAVGNQKSMITLEMDVHDPGLAQPQISDRQGPALGTEGKISVKASLNFFSEVSKAANRTDGDSGKSVSTAAGPETNLGSNPPTPELQNNNAAQPDWNSVPETSESMSDMHLSPGPMMRKGNQQTAIQGALEDGIHSLSAQDKAQSAQLNFDFWDSGASESRQGTPNQSAWISEIRDGSLTDNLTSPETEESQSNISPTTLLGKSLKIMQGLQENAGTMDPSADQGQAAYTSVQWTAMHGKTEPAQMHFGQPPLSAAERELQVQSVFASPAQNGESAGAVSVSPAQSSTPHKREFVLQLADQIHIQLRDGKGEIRIQLKPDSFGRLEIRAENTIQGVSVRISTESSAVKSYLENNMQLLQQTLQDQGLKIDRIHIVVQDAFDSQSSSGFTAQSGYTGSGQNGKDSQFSSGKSGLSPVNPIEDGILDPASWLALNPNNRFYTVA